MLCVVYQHVHIVGGISNVIVGASQLQDQKLKFERD